MQDDAIEFFEQRLAKLPMGALPSELRAAVLNDMQRELRAARWDRRLARAAAVLMIVGVGLNVVFNRPRSNSSGVRETQVARDHSQQSLTDTAVVVAEATNATTGSLFARQLAAMTGRALTADEAAAIDAAIERASTRPTVNGNKG